MCNAFVTKSAEEKHSFITGSIRDTEAGKPRYDLIHADFHLSFISRWWAEIEDEAPLCSDVEFLTYLAEFPGVIYGLAESAVWLAVQIARKEYAGGMVHPQAVTRLAALMSRGAAKYGENNWAKGQNISRVYSSLMRHYYQWLEYQVYQTSEETEPEDHFAAMLFNLMALYAYYSNRDNLPEELFDLKPIIIGE